MKPPQRALTAASIGAAALLAGLLAGCASPATFQFTCTPDINDGLLLTVDLVQVDEAEAAQIRQLGEQWFYSDLRRQLAPRLSTVAVEGGCNTTAKITAQKGYETLAIVSDYKGGGAGASGNVQTRGKGQWKGKKLQVQVGSASLTVVGGR